MTKKVRFIFRELVWVLLIMVILKTFQKDFSQHFITAVIIVTGLSLLRFAPLQRGQKMTVKLTFPDRKDFWSDLMDALEELDFVPVAQMEGQYFFNSSWLGTTQVVAAEMNPGSCKLTFNSALHKALMKKLSVYHTLTEIKEGFPKNLPV